MNFDKEHGNEIIVFLDAALYSKDSLFKCLYWYSGDFNVSLSTTNDNHYKITLIPLNKEVLPSQKIEEIYEKLKRDFVDFNLRDIVTKETQNIRDLLIAKAFSHGEFDELPPGELSDPVGFNINDL